MDSSCSQVRRSLPPSPPLSLPAPSGRPGAAGPRPDDPFPFLPSGDYPFKPPDIKLFTPSGRFKPETKICTSMTSFHPSTWNPAWSVATILTGLLSFMLSEEITTGSMTASSGDRKALAEKSHAFNIGNKKFRDIFPEVRLPFLPSFDLVSRLES